jgi:hypothetical protein
VEGRKSFENYMEALYSKGEYQILENKRIELDKFTKSILEKANPVAAIRWRNAVPTDSPKYKLNALQSPLIGYFDAKGIFRVISGVFTFQQVAPEPQQVPAFVLQKCPTANMRKQMLLNELTRCLLDQCFVNSPSLIADYLLSWFDTHHQSLFRNKDWQKIYPEITTKKQFCERLGISFKMFRVK